MKIIYFITFFFEINRNDKINKKVTESDSDDLIIDVVSIEPPSSTAQQHLEIKQEFLQENELNESNDHVSIVTEATESKIDMLKTSGQIEVIDEMVRKVCQISGRIFCR